MRSWVILVLVAALVVEVRLAFLIDHDVPLEPNPMSQVIALAGLEQGDVTLGDQLAARAKVVEEARARAAQSPMPDLGIRLVRGVVVHEGRPVSDAAVSLEMRSITDGVNLDGYPSLPWPVTPWRIQTDGRGYFEFKRLPKSDFVVRAWHNGRLALAGVSFDESHLVWDGVLKLESTQPLGGKVVDAGGMPIADALVFPFVEGAAPQSGAYWLSFLPETTDAAGTFLFTHAPGACRFIVNAPGYGTWVTRACSPGTAAQIVAECGGGISGVLSRAHDQQPAANLAVRLEAVTYPLMARRTKTDLNGEFSFANLPAGDYRVALDTDRFAFASGTASVAVRAGASVSPRQALDVTRTQAARGRVVDETGAGVSGLTVAAWGASIVQAKTDFAGYYRLPRLVPGEYQVVLRGAAGLIVEAVPGTTITVQEGEDPSGPTFKVRPGAGKGRVIFQVLDSSGRAAGNAAIFYLAAPNGVAVPGADAMAGAVIADAEGRYVWEGVPRDWQFRAYASTGVMVSPLLERSHLGDRLEATVTMTLSEKAAAHLEAILAALRP